MLLAVTAPAIQARQGVWRLLTLADGSQVKAELCGDEHGSYYSDAQGRHYLATADGRYQLASEQQLEALLGEAALARSSANAGRSTRRRVSPDFLQGERRGLIILVSFADNAFEADHDRAFFQRFANERGFSEAPFRGSVRDYFYDQSCGQFDLQFDVVGPYTLAHDIEWYGHHYGFLTDARVGTMIREACELADPDVSFSDYDWDGDGLVEQVFVLYAGFGEADGGDENTVWPQEGTLTKLLGAPITLDDVTIDTYGCANELAGVHAYDADGHFYYTGEGRICGIGTICHEYSHCMGFPDTYDTKGSSFGMGAWDIMSSGNYMGESYCPAGYTSWERWTAGWMEPIELTDSVQVDGLRPLADGGDAYVVYLDNPDRVEYLLLENRQHVGWDSQLYGKGLLVIHVDYKESFWEHNTVNAISYHQRMTVEHADNDSTRYDQSHRGDAYPYDPIDVWGDRVSEKRPTVDDLIDYFNERDGCTYSKQRNNALSTTSTPAIWQYNGTHEKHPVYGRDLTDITQHDDLTVSFHFGGSSDTAIRSLPLAAPAVRGTYGPDGRRTTLPRQGVSIVRHEDGTVSKVLSGR